MNKIKFESLVSKIILLFMSIQPSYASTSIDDGLRYAINVIESRSQYLNSLRDFVIDPEISIPEKMDLIESVSSKKYGRKMREFIDSLPEELKDQEFQKIIDNFTNNLEFSPRCFYDNLGDILRLGLDFISSPYLIGQKNLFQKQLEALIKLNSELNWKEFDQRAKLIAGYAYLALPLGAVRLEKISRNVESFMTDDPDITNIKTEFHRTELEVLEDLKKYLLSLMPEKDREMVENFRISWESEKLSRKRGIGCSLWFTRKGGEEAYFNSFDSLGLEFEILNDEFFRINKKINKKLRVKKVAEKLSHVPELENLDEPPKKTSIEKLVYFLKFTKSTMYSKFKYIYSNIELTPPSEQKLIDLLVTASEIQGLGQTALNHDFGIRNILPSSEVEEARETCDLVTQILREKMKQEKGPVNFSLLRENGESMFLYSYTRDTQDFILAEATQFNTELSRKVSSFTELLKSFDEHGIRGNKHQFKPISRTSLSSLDLKSLNEFASFLASFSDLLSQISPPKEPIERIENFEVTSDETELAQELQTLDSKLERTEELEAKETQNTVASPTPVEPFGQDYKIYSSYLGEAEKLPYQEKLKRELSRKHLTLLDTLYSSKPGEIRFDDLRNLVRRCGGILEFSRGSHFRITMPCGKVAFGFRPHGSEHGSKLRNLALESFRTALSEVKEAVLVR